MALNLVGLCRYCHQRCEDGVIPRRLVLLHIANRHSTTPDAVEEALWLTRLGGRKLDRSNIPAATKGVEDAVAFMLGCNDGDMRWRAEWDQEPGGPVGVRVEVSAYENAKVA